MKFQYFPFFLMAYIASSSPTNITTITEEFMEELLIQQTEICPYIPLCTIRAENITRPMLSVNSAHHCCLSCSCEDSCLQEGYCCPDKTFTNRTDNFTASHNYVKPECIYPALKQPNETKEIYTSPYQMISKCPDKIVEGVNKAIIQRCNHRNKYKQEEMIPVYSVKTKTIYTNKFCAACHRETEDALITWLQVIKCRFFKIIENEYGLVDAVTGFDREGLSDEIIRRIMDDGNNLCNIEYEPPDRMVVVTEICVPKHFSLIETCSSEDYLHKTFLEIACKAYTLPYGTVYSSTTLYKNVFCFLCSGFYRVFQNMDSETCSQASHHKFNKVFTAVLNYDNEFDSSTPKNERCNRFEIYDPYKRTCRLLYCPMFSVSQLCEAQITRPNIDTVHFRLSIVPYPRSSDLSIETAERFADKLLKSVWNGLSSRSVKRYLDSLCDITTWYATKKDENNLTYVDYVLLLVNAKAKLELALMYEGLYESITNLPLIEIDGHLFTLILDNKPYEVIYRGNSNVKNIQYYHYTFEPSTSNMGGYCMQEITLTKFVFCPQIEIGLTDYRMLADRQVVLPLYSGLVLSDNDYFITETDEGQKNIRVCFDDVSEAFRTIPGLFSTWCPVFVLSVISLVCLVSTLVMESRSTYHRKDVETYHAVLIGYVALGCIASEAIHGFKTTLDCRVFTLINHFCWLNIPFWLLFQAQKSYKLIAIKNNYSVSEKSWKVMISRFLFANCVSGLLVTMNVIIALIISDKQRFGYDKEFCCISHTLLLVVSYIMPVVTIFSATLVYVAISLKYIFSNRKEMGIRLCQNVRQLSQLILVLGYTTGIYVSSSSATLLRMDELQFSCQILVSSIGIFLFVIRWLLCLLVSRST